MAIDPGRVNAELLVHGHDERVGEQKVAGPPHSTTLDRCVDVAHRVQDLLSSPSPAPLSRRDGGAGVAPNGGSYATFATFCDPDGNSWLLQEIKTRLPGRGLSNLDLATLTELLRDAEQRHGAYKPTAPKHHWSDFYAAYIVAREHGQAPEEAVKAGVLNVERARR